MFKPMSVALTTGKVLDRIASRMGIIEENPYALKFQLGDRG